MTRRETTHSPALSLLCNLILVYAAYTLCRLTFVITNWALYADGLMLGHMLSLFIAGLRFDTTAILYTNTVVMLLMLFPLHRKENRTFYHIVRWIYVIVNSLALYANLADCVYFPYTGKRTTTSVFAEFGHEGAGQMTQIILRQMGVHWYLVVLGLLMTWGLWKGFRPVPFRVKKFHNRRKLILYYMTQLLALAAAIPLTIGGMRGGFTKAVRPITISNANQYTNRPAETGIVLNTPFSVFRTLGKRTFVTPDYMSREEAGRIFSPVHRPNDDAEFQPNNVVVLILESFSKQHMGCYNRTLRNGTYKGFTPFLDSLVEHSALSFQYSYANGRKSIEGMPSVLSSLPNYVEPLFLTPASLNRMSGLAHELGENKGYTTAFFHGAENGSMGFQAFARTTGFKLYYGRTEYNADPNHLGDKDFDGTWAIWDEEFLQFYAEEMSRMKEPFMTAVFTASSHDPFKIPQRYEGRLPEGERPLQRAIAYTDHALKHFFERASREPWFKRTLFVITADHTSNQIDPFYTTTLGQYCVPIIFYAPSDSSLRGYDTRRVIQQVDIMPTVLSWLHYDKPYVAFGTDLLQDSPEVRNYALHWVPESSGYEYVENDYVLEFDGQQVNAAYRFRTDSLLRHNVLDNMPNDTLRMMERHLKSVIQQYMERMNEDRLTLHE